MMVSGYKVIIGRPMFVFAPFMKHGVNTKESDGKMQTIYMH
jgi:hypothetical protein